VEGGGKNHEEKNAYLLERAKSCEVGLGGRSAPAVHADLRAVTGAAKSLLGSQPHTSSTTIPCSPTIIRETKGGNESEN
jgi:hypothetical protein